MYIGVHTYAGPRVTHEQLVRTTGAKVAVLWHMGHGRSEAVSFLFAKILFYSDSEALLHVQYDDGDEDKVDVEKTQVYILDDIDPVTSLPHLLADQPLGQLKNGLYATKDGDTLSVRRP